MKRGKIIFTIGALAVLLFALSGCKEEHSAVLDITVLDETGAPVNGATVTLYADKPDWAGYTDPISEAVLTGADGRARLEAFSNGRSFVDIKAGNSNNRFGKIRTSSPLEVGRTISETFSVRPPTSWEVTLSGGGSKRWALAPLMTPQGQPFLDYPVDTDMYIDGRWYDSNGRLGLWWFNADETKIFYDYATSGAVVSSTMRSLSDTLFQAEIDFFGIRMLIEMYPV